VTKSKEVAPDTHTDPVEAGPVPEGGAEPYPPEGASEAAPVPTDSPVWEGGDPGTATPPPPEPPPPEPEVEAQEAEEEE